MTLISSYCLIFSFCTFFNQPIDFPVLLNTIAQLESNNGTNKKDRYEPNFEKKYGQTPIFRQIASIYGPKATATSYGKYQIMFLKAHEVGFEVSPEELRDDYINERIACKIVGDYIEKYGDAHWSVNKIFKRYNGGQRYADRATNLYFANVSKDWWINKERNTNEVQRSW